MLGSEVIVDVIVAHNLKRVYAYPGGTIAPILEALHQRGIEIIVGRTEQGAGYAALAEARLTGKTQVVLCTSGPGVTNMVTPIADALFDSVPLILIAGQVGTGDLYPKKQTRQQGFQQVNTVDLMYPISLAAYTVNNPNQLYHVVEKAFHVANNTARPGPVVIDMPMDIQRKEIDSSDLIYYVDNLYHTKPDIKDSDIALIVEAIEHSQRPVIIAGHGVILADACSRLRILSYITQVPISQSLLGVGAIPSDDPMCLGFHGHTGNQVAGKAIYNSDLLLVLGSRLDVRQTGSLPCEFAPSAKIIRVDSDVLELRESRVDADIVIQGDAGDVIDKLFAYYMRRPYTATHTAEWLQQIDDWRAQYPLDRDALENNSLTPQKVIRALNKLTKDYPHVIVTTGVGSHQSWVARHFDFDWPKRVLLTSGGHGAMGFDLPAAIGAQIAYPDALVLCVVGDGSFQMNIQEMATIRDLNLPIKMIVEDNQRLALVSQFQKFNWPTDVTCGDKWNPDFAAIANAYGLYGESVYQAWQLNDMLETVLAHPGPALLHCIVDPSEDISPMLLGGQRVDQMWSKEQ